MTHFVFFPAMEFLTRIGVFGGSNALWRTADLQAFEFRHDVQTEDIELSTRAMLGDRFFSGLGVQRNLGLAFRSYRISAEAGLVRAMNCVGCMYARGLGVEADHVEEGLPAVDQPRLVVVAGLAARGREG